MSKIPFFFTALVALEHLYITVLEMFLWTHPKTLKIFNLSENFAKQTQKMAANQGLYNAFLAAGLIWGLLHPDLHFGLQIQFFFLSCVVVAGIYGALSSNRSLFFKQGLPAIITLCLHWFLS